MFKLDLEKAEEPEIKLPTSVESSKKQESSRKTATSALTMLKPFIVDHEKLWKILQEVEIPANLTVSWEICMEVKKQQLKPDMEQWTASKLGKEYTSRLYIVTLLI